MSNRYLGGFITNSPTQPTTSVAIGVWTLSQQSQAKGNGIWPLAINPTPTVEYLVIAGGAGGAVDRGGGGGAGGYRTATGFSVSSGSAITVTVGAGGNGSTSGSNGSNGSNSVFSSITSTGGGGRVRGCRVPARLCPLY